MFRRGSGVNDMWDQLYANRSMRLLYIAGSGFDVRAQTVMRECVDSIRNSGATVGQAKLVMIDFANYRLDKKLEELTEQNSSNLVEIFSTIGTAVTVSFGTSNDEDLSASRALRQGSDAALAHFDQQTDVILDASSLPRVVYLALMTSLLHQLIPDKSASNALYAQGINFQVLVAEDAKLDGQIMAEDPDNEIVMVPGFSGPMHVESMQDLPFVWFPILGENRVNQMKQIMQLAEIPGEAEICPVLPHPSRDPRRADNLLIEYREPLFDSRGTPINNLIYAHESHPFEVYRQLLGAMTRYRNSMKILDGCRLVVTPFGSKLITLGAGLACFEMRPENLEDFGVAIPHAEPTRYVVNAQEITSSKPEICTLLLTGEAYQSPKDGSDL